MAYRHSPRAIAQLSNKFRDTRNRETLTKRWIEAGSAGRDLRECNHSASGPPGSDGLGSTECPQQL